MAKRTTEGRSDTTFPINGVLAAIVLGLLAIATALTLKPFSAAILWAIVLAVSTAPLHGWLTRRMPGRPRAAALISTALLALILIVPAYALTRGIIAYTPDITAWVDQVSGDSFSTAPAAIRNIPFVGSFLSTNWEIISQHINSYVAHFKADIEDWLVWGLQQVESVGLFVFEIGFAVILAGVFLANRARLTHFAIAFFDRIGGGFATQLLTSAVVTTRSTVRGVVGSAIAESIVAAVGYWIAGVPAWALLGGLTFFAALVQVGAPLVWIPVALWLFAQNEPGWAIFMIAWGIVLVYSVENLSRPILAGKASHLPGLLIFVGVLGGLLAWGLIGIFLGPVILAVAYQLIQEWLKSEDADREG
ncbi:MAG: AI-2E family transporter [Bauldia sp.]|nr:AI-2E family transporter [Bauldia sp.]